MEILYVFQKNSLRIKVQIILETQGSWAFKTKLRLLLV